MSTNRKMKELNPVAIRNKICKILKDAKGDLDPGSYGSLIDILAKYYTGNPFLSGRGESRL